MPILWPVIFSTGCQIEFAHTSFKWTNLAAHNAGVTVAIIGISPQRHGPLRLFSLSDIGTVIEKQCDHINAYLVSGPNVLVEKVARPLGGQSEMTKGNQPTDGGNLLLTRGEVDELKLGAEQRQNLIRRIYGSEEFIRGLERYCLWIDDVSLEDALENKSITDRVNKVRQMRLDSPKAATVGTASTPYRFGEVRQTGRERITIVSSVSSERREYLPVALLAERSIVTNSAFALLDAPLWNMAIIASRLHLVWIGTVCGKMKTDFRYSNTLGWNTFPVPTLTDKNKEDLTRCAEGILLARETHFPATIADLYDPEKMPGDLRDAHERNDEVLERIYIGRRFRNDTERLEKLFELYTKMTANNDKVIKPRKGPQHE